MDYYLDRLANRIFRIDDRRYKRWFYAHRVTEEERNRQKETVFPKMPLISVLVPLYKTPISFLREMIDSVLDQSYPRFELILANASPEEGALSEALREYGERDERVKILPLSENGGISKNTNAALYAASGEWAALLDHDDVLEPDALFSYVKALNETPEAAAFYSDEDKITEKADSYFFPAFKPDLREETLLTNNYVCHFLMAEMSLLKTLGGLDPFMDGAQDYDLVLRLFETGRRFIHVPRVLYHWRSYALSTAKSAGAKDYASDAGARALKAHFDRMDVPVTIDRSAHAGWYTVHPSDAPRMEDACEILIRDHTAKGLLSDLEKTLPFVRTPYVILRGMFLEKPEDEALSVLLEPFFNGKVVMSAGKLLKSKRRLLSAGKRITPDGDAVPYFEDLPKEKPGFSCRAVTRCNVSAVSLSFSAFRTDFLLEAVRTLLPKADGLSLSELEGAIGLYAHEKGLRGVFVPEAEALSLQNAAAKRVKREKKALSAYFQERAFQDPDYSPNWPEKGQISFSLRNR